MPLASPECTPSVSTFTLKVVHRAPLSDFVKYIVSYDNAPLSRQKTIAIYPSLSFNFSKYGPKW